MTEESISNTLPVVKSESVSPLLDNTYQNSVKISRPAKGRISWSRKQKRNFPKVLTFLKYCQAHGFQCLWLTLTGSLHSDGALLREHYQDLISKIKREFGYDIVSYTVRTNEGPNGTLHCIWAIKSKRAVWIPQDWLSAEWERIHGAKITWIRRIGAGKNDAKRLSRYVTSQYISDQSSFVSSSYSWKKLGVAILSVWDSFKREMRKYSELSTWCGLNPCGMTVPREKMYALHDRLVRNGSCLVNRTVYFLTGGRLD